LYSSLVDSTGKEVVNFVEAFITLKNNGYFEGRKMRKSRFQFVSKKGGFR